MFFEDEENPNNEQAKIIVRDMIDGRRAGFFYWDIDNQTCDISEKLSGREYKDVTTLPDLIHQLVFEKDREIALQDLEDFMTGKKSTYQSTFRIIDAEENILWIFCKGSMMPGNQLNGVMYNVSANNLMQGHDLKTNLMNNETFIRKLNNAIAHAEENNKNGALLYIDFDNFHTIINKYGFEFGNSILFKMSRVLLRFIEARDEIAHFSYDKFMILLNEIEDIAKVERISKEIREIFKEPFIVDGQPIYLNVHMGITLFPEFSMNADELLRYSNFASSHARESNSRTAVYFDAELMASYSRNMDIENELPGAISEQEFYLVYQPQLDLKTNKINGFETLIRWENKNLGLVPPAEFIPVAENKGYIVTIGRWIFKESIKTARKWLDKGIHIEKMAVNVSSVEFLQKGFKEYLLFVCKYYAIDPSMIELEITERVLMNTNEDNQKIMNDIMSEGFKIALDDFGTGYSNFSTLLNFGINTLKLDKSLIDNINDDIRRYFLKSLIYSKNFLGYKVIAEGVEDQETMDILSELDCDTIQGYHFSKPMMKGEMEKFIFDFQ